MDKKQVISGPDTGVIQGISANDTLGKTDDESIRLAIAKAKETGVNRVVIPKYNARTGKTLWLIEDTIILPSDIEIVIDDAHLMLGDNIITNMFRNENAGTELGRTVAGEQHNITIRGQGAATLDGGNYNGYGERVYMKTPEPKPSVMMNSTILLCNVSNVVIKNLNVIRQRYWAITNIFVHHSTYSNLRFRSDFSRMDEDGVVYPNEIPRHYEEVYVKNSDGIDFRIGCHHIEVNNITGFIEDDAVAMTALGTGEKLRGFYVEGLPGDIHDIKIHHVSVEAYCAAVRLLNDEGNKLYNVEIDGVHYLRGQYGLSFGQGLAIRIGDRNYAKNHSNLGDTYNITIRNVVTQGRCAVALCKGLKDSLIENVIVRHHNTTLHPTNLDFDGLYNYKSGVCAYPGDTAQLENCTIRDITVEHSKIVPFRTEGITGTWTYE